MLAALVLGQYVVDVPTAVEKGNCQMSYIPPKFSDGIWHEGVVYIWADKPVEVRAGSERHFGTELRLVAGGYVSVRNPHDEGVVYVLCAGEPKAPIGVADYGIAMTAPPVAYSYETAEVRGAVTLRSFDAYSTEQGNGFSIQLNAVAEVRTEKSTYHYWLQNVLDVRESRYYFDINIWNGSAPVSRLRGDLLRGAGSVVKSEKGDFYGSASAVRPLRLPLSAVLYIRVGVSQEGYPWFAFGYDLGGGVVWYDNVTLLVKTLAVKIVVRPPREGLTGSRHYMNLELVVGGICCSDHAVFRRLDLDLRLEYWNGSAYVPPPFLYNFGRHTAETAEGVAVSHLGGGAVRLSAGVFRPAFLHSAYVPVRVVDADGARWVVVKNGTVLDLRRASAVYNGTRVIYTGNSLNAERIVVTRPLTVVYFYRREHLVTVRDWNGTSTVWVEEGSVFAPKDLYFGNGTRLAVAGVAVDGKPSGAEITVTRPVEITVSRVRQYLVRLIAPVNSTEAWADEGSVFRVELADPWEPGNGTRFARLLVNGTAARERRVEKPITLVAEYAEVYYRVEVAGFNATRGWAPRGAVLRFPAVLDFGNGTRLVGPSVEEVVVDKPVAVRVEYAKRQYHVRIEGVARWEGWADEGAVITPNATVAGGVAYEPAEPVVVNAPGVYRPLFVATYKTAVRDALGVPNPLAAVRLCNATARPQLDGSVVITAYTRELCQPAVEAAPVSPYTALAAIAAAAAALLARRK